MQCSIPGSFRVLKQIGLALDFTKCASKCTWTFIFVVLYLTLKEWVDKWSLLKASGTILLVAYDYRFWFCTHYEISFPWGKTSEVSFGTL